MINLNRMKVNCLVQGHKCRSLFIHTLTKTVSKSPVCCGNTGIPYLSFSVHC